MSLITPDPGLLIWMTVVFAIVFFILAKFGFPLITGMVDKRSSRIEESIAKAREAEKSLGELSASGERIILEAKAEQARILKETSALREKMLSDAREQAGEEAAKIVLNAKTQIAAEREAALGELRAEVASLSVEVAEKILRAKLEKSGEQAALVDRYVDEASRAELS